MKTRVVRIGNSRGIRIPKLLLEQTGLPEEVGITAEGESLVIRPAKRPRAGWAAAFDEMARRGDDVLLDAVVPTVSNWDETEWE
jgi:antitoxin MazE